MAAANLLRRAFFPLNVVLIERADKIGRGLAYSTTEPAHLLNVPCSKMGARPDDIEAFFRWAQTMQGNVSPASFLERAQYGEYVESEVMSAANAAQPGVVLRRVRDEARNILPGPDGTASVLLTCGERIEAQHIVLALGSGPARIPESLTHLSDAPERLISQPFAPDALRTVRPNERLLIIGTGLTMYDATMTLARHGFCGGILALSRRGRTPQPHTEHHIPLWASDWARSLTTICTAADLVHAVRAGVRRASSEGGDWRGVIDSMRPHLPALWKALSLDERRTFLRHLAPFWEVHRHRCAPEISATIHALRARGMLDVQAGRIVRCTIRQGEVVAAIIPRGALNAHEHRFDRVLVCAGPETDVSRWRLPLMQQLLRDGLVAPDALGLGLSSCEDGAALSQGEKRLEWLSLLGPLRKADLWESTAVPELRVHCRLLAERIILALCRRHNPMRPLT